MLKKFLIAVAILFPTPTLADEGGDAMDIQKVTTPSGITAWLVESHSLPMVSVEVAFRAGSAFDPQGKGGTANLTAALLTQGAGELDAAAFQKEKDRLGARIAAGADTLNITAGFDALAEVTDKTFALFATALKNPTFDKADFTRLKKAVVAGRKRVEEQPRKLAQEAFAEVVYGRYHPYSHPTSGTLRSLENIQVQDIKKYHRKMFTRANMVVSVVGAVTPQELSALLEEHLGDLPKGRKAMAVDQPPQEQPPVRQVIKQDIPQTTIVMGHKGLNRSHDDYFAALVTNHILGGGGFSAQLMQEVREKRGLVYGIYSYFNPMPYWGAFRVVAQTKNQSAGQVVEIVKDEISKLRTQGVSQEDFDAAISYLVGSFPLRLDSNSDILKYLTFMQTENLGVDYMNNWVSNIMQVSRADVRAAARKYMHPDEMAVVMVGQPGQQSAPADAAPKPTPLEKVAPEVSTSVKTPPAERKPAEDTGAEKPTAPVAPQAPEPVQEEAVAAPVQKAQPTPQPEKKSYNRWQQRQKAPVPSQPENPQRRNVNSDEWL